MICHLNPTYSSKDEDAAEEGSLIASFETLIVDIF